MVSKGKRPYKDFRGLARVETCLTTDVAERARKFGR